ncbi:hypothetical protein [Fervidibacillus albus]|uniref:Uncharacterized protein n=1 Tax=Fervidibacillus albus TaxID=2980026 RepID=A0A9E8LWG9_9BACI|nr:hypothetical protein [Fervidibacillus albus]WAA10610.1 hypothetical protein OE104_04640 [Fervidibacillus albus]
MTKRNLFSILIFALLFISFLLIWQWDYYQMEAKKGIDTAFSEKVNQQIEVTHTAGKITVVQKLENVMDGRYRLQYPSQGENFICETGENTVDCSDEQVVVEENGIQFTYDIQLDSDDERFLLDNWLIELENVSIIHTEVHISETVELDSTWAAGGEMKTDEKMEFVHYYLFEKEGDGFPLYWQQEPLSAQSFGKFTIYGNRDFQIGNHSITSFIENEQDRIFPTIVFAKVETASSMEDLIIVPEDVDENELYRLWMNEYFSQGFFQTERENQWLAEVFTGLLFQIPISGKAEEMAEQLAANMDEEEIDRFFNLIETEETVGVVDLDERLGEVKQGKTEFFALNKEETDPLYPLYFYLDKQIVVDEQSSIDKKIYIVHSTHYYPAKEVVQSLGYTYEIISDEEIFVYNERDAYRFYYGKNLFILNEEQYGLFGEQSKDPFLKFDGEWYIQEDLLVRLFSVQILEYESEIRVF